MKPDYWDKCCSAIGKFAMMQTIAHLMISLDKASNMMIKFGKIGMVLELLIVAVSFGIACQGATYLIDAASALKHLWTNRKSKSVSAEHSVSRFV